MTAITRPFQWAAGLIHTDARDDQDHDAILLAQDPPMAIVRRVATQSINNNSFTDVSFDTEDVDNDGLVNLGTFPTRVTLAHDGYYVVMFGVTWGSNGTGVRAQAATLNATEISGTGFEIPAFTGNPRHGGGNGFIGVTGDIVRLNVFQNSGGALTITARMTVFRISGPGS